MKNHLMACFNHPFMALRYFKERFGNGCMDDKEYLEFTYEYLRGKKINIDNPKTYTDKLNWMKVYDHNELYTKLVDKLYVKKNVSNIIGSDYVIPLLNVYDNVDEIDIDKLPDKFVLKCTHDSGNVFICEDKTKFDLRYAKDSLRAQLDKDYSKGGREWAYKDVPRKIIAEQYIDDLADNNYKFFCFRGEVKALYVAPFRERYVDYFDRDFNHLDIFTDLHGPAPYSPEKPECYEEMRTIAEHLSGDMRAVRVDLYLSHGKIYFGEFTFFHEAGFMPFQPDSWNYEFGSWIDLN